MKFEEKIKDLGMLDNDSRFSTCWNEKTISGSRFSKWVLTPEKYEEQENLNFIKQKLKWGNLIEPLIREQTINVLGDYVNFFNNTINLNTYQRTDYEFCYANIDGAFINADGETVLMEFKNTEIEDFDFLKKKYEYQMLYYCWFFNVKKIVFAVLINGCNHQWEEITFNQSDLDFVEERVKEFKKYLETGETPKNKIELEKPLTNKEILNIIGLYEEKNKELKEIEKVVNQAKADILNFMKENHKTKMLGVNLSFELKTRKGSSTWDTEKLTEYLEKNELDIIKFKKQGKDSEYLATLKIKEW